MQLFPPFERSQLAYILSVLHLVGLMEEEPTRSTVQKHMREACDRLVGHAEANGLRGVYVETYQDTFNLRNIGIRRPAFYELVAQALHARDASQISALIENSYASHLNRSAQHRQALATLVDEYEGRAYGQVVLGPDEADAESEEGLGFVPQPGDEREVAHHLIRRRRGQQRFREALRARYSDRCVITGCDLVDVLEAAHISPYRGQKDNDERNGLLLRADIHTLFDLDLVGIHPETLIVEVDERARTTPYAGLQGTVLKVPSDLRPSRAALALRWEQFQRTNER